MDHVQITKEFKKELHDLLEKYHASLGVRADAGSDWWGITGEEFVVAFDDYPEIVPLNDGGLWVDSIDLKEEK